MKMTIIIITTTTTTITIIITIIVIIYNNDITNTTTTTTNMTHSLPKVPILDTSFEFSYNLHLKQFVSKCCQ